MADRPTTPLGRLRLRVQAVETRAFYRNGNREAAIVRLSHADAVALIDALEAGERAVHLVKVGITGPAVPAMVREYSMDRIVPEPTSQRSWTEQMTPTVDRWVAEEVVARANRMPDETWVLTARWTRPAEHTPWERLEYEVCPARSPESDRPCVLSDCEESHRAGHSGEPINEVSRPCWATTTEEIDRWRQQKETDA